MLKLCAAAAACWPLAAFGATYCRDSLPISGTAAGLRDLVARVTSHCRPGDTILIEGWPQGAAILCDRGQPVSVDRGVTNCALAAEPASVR